MTRRIFVVVLMFLVVSRTFSNNTHKILLDTIQLLGDEHTPPTILNSNSDWVPIGVIDWNTTSRKQETEDSMRLWRVRSRYEHQVSSGQATVQIRIRSKNNTSVFTLPWASYNTQFTENYSNWLEDINKQVSNTPRSIVEAKLIAPPRIHLKSKLYTVILEAWDRIDSSRPAYDSSQVQLAYAHPLPTVNPNSGSPSPSEKEESMQQALEFALKFVEYCITGNLASYYRMHNDKVYSMENGRIYDKYSLPPPQAIDGVQSIEDYKKLFYYNLYDKDDYKDMFPQWFDSSREWTPTENTYLFMGQSTRNNQVVASNVDYLVFLVVFDKTGQWKIIGKP